jgi:hypothetical protein
MELSTTSTFITAIGYRALRNNSTGFRNTAIGSNALENNTTGYANSAVGYYALQSNTTGRNNTAFGDAALGKLTEGSRNTAVGFYALTDNTTGINNTAFGSTSLSQLKTGNYNTAVGGGALNTNIAGNNNTGIGYYADLTTDGINNAIVIGYNAKVASSNTVAIGNADVSKWVFGISNTTNSGYALQVGSTTNNGNGAFLTNGGVWTNASSRDFKEGFEDVDGVSLLNKIDSLNITKWRYKGTNELHIGPIAEEFKQLFQLGVQDDDKHISTIDASGVALKAVQVLRRELAEKEKEIRDLKQQVNSLKSLEEKMKILEKRLANIKE